MAKTKLGINTRCANCGRALWKGESVYVKGGVGKIIGLGALNTMTSGGSSLGKFYCSQGCLNAAGGSGTGESGSSSSGFFSKNSEAEDAANRTEEQRKKAAHKEAIRNIKYTEFPADDEGFIRAAHIICDDYSECHPGLLADGEYKRAYKKRIESELKMLKDSNPAHYEKFSEFWQEAVQSMKKRRKVRLILSGILFFAIPIIFGIMVARDDGEFASGFIPGLVFGAIIATLPQISGFGKSKTEDE